MALRAVHEDRDCQQVVPDRHLAAGEDRPGRDGELVRATLAPEHLAGLVGVGSRGSRNAGKPARLACQTSGSAWKAFHASSSDMRATVANESDRAAEERRKCCDIGPTFSVDLIDKRGNRGCQRKSLGLTKRIYGPILPQCRRNKAAPRGHGWIGRRKNLRPRLPFRSRRCAISRRGGAFR